MHYYQFNIGDYAKHTQHLTLIEHLAYRLLLDRYYLNEKPLELDSKKLARLVGMSNHLPEVEQVLEDFFDRTDDGFSNSRCDKEIEAFKAKADIARVNGQKGGRPRKPKANPEKSGSEPRETQPVKSANPEETGSKAKHKPITINQEPLTKNQTKDSSASADTDVNIAFDYWCSVMGKAAGRTILTDKRKKAVKARFKEGYTLEDIKGAILGCSKDSWSMGQNERQKAFNDLELICRTGEKLEQYRDSTNQPFAFNGPSVKDQARQAQIDERNRKLGIPPRSQQGDFIEGEVINHD